MCSFNRHKNKNKPTITNISDKQWNIISSILPTEKPNKTIGRPVIPYRKVIESILYVLRTWCQWKILLPFEFGFGSTCHRRFEEWDRIDIFKNIWIRLLTVYGSRKSIKWTWQSLDSISIKSPLEGGNG